MDNHIESVEFPSCSLPSDALYQEIRLDWRSWSLSHLEDQLHPQIKPLTQKIRNRERTHNRGDSIRLICFDFAIYRPSAFRKTTFAESKKKNLR